MSQDWQANQSSPEGWDAGRGPGRAPAPSPGYGAPPTYGAPPSYQAPPPPGYGSPPGAYGGYQPGYGRPPTSTDGSAIAALVLAICSFVFPVILAVIALAIIPGSRRTIEMSGGAVDGLGVLTAAKVIAWINIGVSLLVVIGFVLLVALWTTTSTNNALALMRAS